MCAQLQSNARRVSASSSLIPYTCESESEWWDGMYSLSFHKASLPKGRTKWIKWTRNEKETYYIHTENARKAVWHFPNPNVFMSLGKCRLGPFSGGLSTRMFSRLSSCVRGWVPIFRLSSKEAGPNKVEFLYHKTFKPDSVYTKTLSTKMLNWYTFLRDLHCEWLPGDYKGRSTLAICRQ